MSEVSGGGRARPGLRPHTVYFGFIPGRRLRLQRAGPASGDEMADERPGSAERRGSRGDRPVFRHRSGRRIQRRRHAGMACRRRAHPVGRLSDVAERSEDFRLSFPSPAWGPPRTQAGDGVGDGASLKAGNRRAAVGADPRRRRRLARRRHHVVRSRSPREPLTRLPAAPCRGTSPRHRRCARGRQ